MTHMILLTLSVILVLAWGMHDLHLLKASIVKPWAHLTDQSYRFSPCRAVAKAFASNIQRVNGTLMLPGHAFLSGKDWQRCVHDVSAKFFGDRNPTHEEFLIARDKFTTAAALHRKNYLAARSPEQSKQEFYVACHNIETFAKENRYVFHWIHDLLKSSVIQAWSAYEVLTDDLWHAVDKKRPALINSCSGKEKKLIGFLSRKRIGNSYRLLFRNDNAEILSVVDDPAIHALGVVRNVLVHSAGRIDAMFQKDRKDIPLLNRIRGQSIGYEIKFTGNLVRFLIDPVVSQGFKLAKSVDKWLIKNP